MALFAVHNWPNKAFFSLEWSQVIIDAEQLPCELIFYIYFFFFLIYSPAFSVFSFFFSLFFEGYFNILYVIVILPGNYKNSRSGAISMVLSQMAMAIIQLHRLKIRWKLKYSHYISLFVFFFFCYN